MAALIDLENVPVYPKLKIIVEMPSVDGEQMIGGGHTIDLEFLSGKTNIETNADRLVYTRGLLNKIGEIALDKIS
jgi:hypothetical protein